MPLIFDLTDFERLTAKLGGAADQMPFALANAMTASTFRVREVFIEDTWPKHVTERNKTFLSSQLRVEKATKRKLMVAISSKDDRAHLKLHDTGGTKTAKKRLAIPATGAVTRTGKGVRKNQTPRAIIANTPKRALRVLGSGIFVGKGGRLHLVYSFRKQARMPHDVPFADTFARVMQSEMRKQFPIALAVAMRTRGLKGHARLVATGRARSGRLAGLYKDRGGLDAFFADARRANGFRSDGSR